MRRLLLLLPLALLAGCTFTPGSGFATIHDALMGGSFLPGARAYEDGTVVTDLGYEVLLDTFTLELGEAALLELQGGAGGLFDPADPPAGYSLCHNGHCHADGGRLVSYAEIEAELSGGSASFAAIVTLAPGDVTDLSTGELREPVWDFLAGEMWPADADEPELPMAELSLLQLPAPRVLLHGVVDGDDLDAPIELSVDLEMPTPFAAGIDFAIDRDLEEPDIAVSVELVIDGTLFDDIDFATVSGGSVITLDDPADGAGAALVENLLTNLPTLHVVEDVTDTP